MSRPTQSGPLQAMKSGSRLDSRLDSKESEEAFFARHTVFRRLSRGTNRRSIADSWFSANFVWPFCGRDTKHCTSYSILGCIGLFRGLRGRTAAVSLQCDHHVRAGPTQKVHLFFASTFGPTYAKQKDNGEIAEEVRRRLNANPKNLQKKKKSKTIICNGLLLWTLSVYKNQERGSTS